MKTNIKVVKIFGRYVAFEERGGIDVKKQNKMSHAAEVNNKEENKMKQTLKEKRRFFKEVASMAREACKAGWAGEDFDLDDFIEENGFDTLLTKEEQEAKAAKDASKAERERKIKELHDFYSSLGEPSEPKEVEEEPTPVKEEEESTTVEETVVEETVQEKEETPEVTEEAEETEEAEGTEEEIPDVGKVRPSIVRASKLFNHVGKFGAAGLRKVKGGYQWTKDKFSGFVAKTKEKTSEFVDKTNFRKNILWNTKMLSAGILGMYSGLIRGIDTLKGGEEMGRLDSYDYYNGEETLFVVILINDSTSEDLFEIPMADVISYQLSDGFITIVTLDTVYTVSKLGEVHTSSC